MAEAKGHRKADSSGRHGHTAANWRGCPARTALGPARRAHTPPPEPLRGPPRRRLGRTPYGRVQGPLSRRGAAVPLDPTGLATGQRLALREDINLKTINCPPGERRRDVILRRGTEFVVLRPPDDDHPDACLIEAEGVVWGWFPLGSLARVPRRGAA